VYLSGLLTTNPWQNFISLNTLHFPFDFLTFFHSDVQPKNVVPKGNVIYGRGIGEHATGMMCSDAFNALDGFQQAWGTMLGHLKI